MQQFYADAALKGHAHVWLPCSTSYLYNMQEGNGWAPTLKHEGKGLGIAEKEHAGQKATLISIHKKYLYNHLLYVTVSCSIKLPECCVQLTTTTTEVLFCGFCLLEAVREYPSPSKIKRISSFRDAIFATVHQLFLACVCTIIMTSIGLVHHTSLAM